MCAIIHFELLSVLKVFPQYIFMLLTYVNIFSIYSFCNMHDISWGTKEGGCWLLLLLLHPCLHPLPRAGNTAHQSIMPKPVQQHHNAAAAAAAKVAEEAARRESEKKAAQVRACPVVPPLLPAL